jgi:hypothetical protein
MDQIILLKDTRVYFDKNPLQNLLKDKLNYTVDFDNTRALYKTLEFCRNDKTVTSLWLALTVKK